MWSYPVSQTHSCGSRNCSLFLAWYKSSQIFQKIIVTFCKFREKKKKVWLRRKERSINTSISSTMWAWPSWTPRKGERKRIKALPAAPQQGNTCLIRHRGIHPWGANPSGNKPSSPVCGSVCLTGIHPHGNGLRPFTPLSAGYVSHVRYDTGILGQ